MHTSKGSAELSSEETEDAKGEEMETKPLLMRKGRIRGAGHAALFLPEPREGLTAQKRRAR